MGETRPPSRTSVKGNRPTGPRPVEVTVVSLLFIAGAVAGLALLVVFELRGTRFGPLENLGAAAGIVVHLVSGILMLRGSQWGRVVFWLGVPVLLPILAALRSFDWLILVGLAATWILLGLLDTEAADRFFFGRLADLGKPLPTRRPKARD